MCIRDSHKAFLPQDGAGFIRLIDDQPQDPEVGSIRDGQGADIDPGFAENLGDADHPAAFILKKYGDLFYHLTSSLLKALPGVLTDYPLPDLAPVNDPLRFPFAPRDRFRLNQLHGCGNAQNAGDLLADHLLQTFQTLDLVREHLLGKLHPDLQGVHGAGPVDNQLVMRLGLPDFQKNALHLRGEDIHPANDQHIIGPSADLGHSQVGPAAGTGPAGQRGNIPRPVAHHRQRLLGKDVYKRQGLHGIGMKCTNALSEWMKTTVFFDGGIYQQEYERGVPKEPVKKIGDTKESGTTHTFLPDEQIFKDASFSFETIVKKCRQHAYLTAGLKITVTDNTSDEKKEYALYFEDGIKSYVQFLNLESKTVGHEPFYMKKEEDEIVVELSLIHI